MKNQLLPSAKWYLLGIGTVAVSFTLGYVARGSDVTNDDRTVQLREMAASLRGIQASLRPQVSVFKNEDFYSEDGSLTPAAVARFNKA